MLRPLLAAALFAVLAVPVSASGSPIVPQLTANVTATSITLVGADGKRVRVLQPNTYRIVVHDRTTVQNFHLVGPGVNISSDLLPCENPAPVNTVMLLPSSTYTYEDSRHPDLTHVVFTTSAGDSSADTAGGSGGPASAKSTGAVSNSSLVGSAVKEVQGTLVGTISSVGRTTLSLGGKSVSSLKSGRYKLTVDDRTPRGGFALEHANSRSAVITGPSFVGRHTVTIYLSAGRWAFSSSTGAKHAFVVVA